MSPRSAAPVTSSLAVALGAVAGVALGATLCVAGCDRGAAPSASPETVYELVDELLEQGDAPRALQLLEGSDLTETEEGRRFRAEAAVMTGAFDDALVLLTQELTLDETTRPILMDACAMGALAALDDGDVDTARRRAEPCLRDERIDLEALRFRLRPGAPTDDEAEAMLESLEAADAGPELDVAAAQVEQAFVAFAASAEGRDASEQMRMLRFAFAVGQDPEIGTQLIEATMAAADALRETDGQGAVNIYERLMVPNTPGLEVPEEVVEQASARAREILFPIYVENLRMRYDRKRAEDDIEAGRFDPETSTFNVGRLDTEERYNAFLQWLFYAQERSRPTPTPDILGAVGICEDRSVPCTFSFEDYARIAFSMRQIEIDYVSANPGVTFEWIDPQKPE